MAITGKKRKKATGATKKRKTRSRVGEAGPKKSIKIAGSGTFSHDSCYGSKTDAKKKADRIRAQGNKARVIETGGRSCVYKGGKMKVNSVFMKTRRSRRRRAA